jgi:hypothetical protein
MKQSLTRRYGYDAARLPARNSLRWFWFAAARPIAFWSSAEPDSAPRRHREPKTISFSHE